MVLAKPARPRWFSQHVFERVIGVMVDVHEGCDFKRRLDHMILCIIRVTVSERLFVSLFATTTVVPFGSNMKSSFRQSGQTSASNLENSIKELNAGVENASEGPNTKRKHPDMSDTGMCSAPSLLLTALRNCSGFKIQEKKGGYRRGNPGYSDWGTRPHRSHS